MNSVQPDTAVALLLKTYRTYKPEEIALVGGATTHAQMKGYSFSSSQFENLPGEPISEEELVKSLEADQKDNLVIRDYVVSAS